MNRDIIKFIAMISMTLNHIAGVFLKPDSWLYYFFCGIGYFTGVVMINFIVEGYQYTSSRKRYFLRLFSFGLLSQLPFVFAFTNNGGRLNMMFSLCICFGIIWALEELDNKLYQVVVITIAFILSFYCDWPLLAPVLTLLLYWAKKSPSMKVISQCIFIVVFWFFQFLDGQEVFSVAINLLYSMLSIIGVVIAFVILNLFYNGKLKRNRRAFSKWFFYLFYPLHLIIIGIVERI
ncbi:MAG: TraX family protein [Lachnospiraceae bacterium]